MPPFRLVSDYAPKGDQPGAIGRRLTGSPRGAPTRPLLGVTGSGKTFTVASVIERLHRPTLVISPNKTLAAQLYGEFKAFFPENAIEYFVSYYDYYQPEAYIPQTDTYIEKDALINDEIDRMRHSTTKSLFERRDVIIVASVSCIYGLGSPESYHGMHLEVAEADDRARDDLLRQLVALQYERNDYDFHRGTFRVRGDVVEIFPASSESVALRVELFGDTVEAIHHIDPLKGQIAGPGGPGAGVPGQPLRHTRRADRAGPGFHPGGAGGAPPLPPGPQPPPGGPAAGAADPVRPGDAAGDRLLPRDRELFAAPGRAGGPGRSRPP